MSSRGRRHTLSARMPSLQCESAVTMDVDAHGAALPVERTPGMRASLALLAELVHGRLVTDAGAVSPDVSASDVPACDVVVSGAAPLGEAGAGDITFLDAAG